MVFKIIGPTLKVSNLLCSDLFHSHYYTVQWHLG